MFGLDRITIDPNVMGGMACIRGMRITVALILNLLGNGMSIEEIIEDYPYLEREDIYEALKFGSGLARDEWQAIGEEVPR